MPNNIIAIFAAKFQNMMFTRPFIIFIFVCIGAQAQYSPPDGVYPDAVFSSDIRTARIFKDGWETSYPISRLDDEYPLVLSFDELANNARTYSYAIIHCDADWRQSRLATSEYMTGFPVNQIRKYEYSFNTLMHYVHYRLTVPNDDVQLRVSGNYAVVVFEDGDEDHPILCRRFNITESLAVISAVAGRARQTACRDEWQQVDFTVRTANYPIENAYNDVKVVILKNGQWHTARTGIKPLFVRQNELDYRHMDATLLFHAGNEYRPLDIKSIRYSSTRMAAIEFERPAYHFYPYTDQPRDAGRYLYGEDFNGKYAIQAEKANRPDTEADYVYVHFTLQYSQPFADGQVYVMGDFCNYACTKNNLMAYNPDKQQYEAVIPLKQGYYNYKYAFLPFGKSAVMDDAMLEGNFYDTENDYIIYVYHRGRSARYDRLIGISTVNTLKK
jgi:hypothetical protein